MNRSLIRLNLGQMLMASKGLNNAALYSLLPCINTLIEELLFKTCKLYAGVKRLILATSLPLFQHSVYKIFQSYKKLHLKQFT